MQRTNIRALIAFIATAGLLMGVWALRTPGSAATAAVPVRVSAAPNASSAPRRSGITIGETRLQANALRKLVDEAQVAASNPMPQKAESGVLTEFETSYQPERAPAPEDHMEHIQMNFDAQAHDAQWTRSLASRLDEQLRLRGGTGSNILALDCRSSLCRVRTQHDEEASYQSYVAALFDSTTGWDGPKVVLRDTTPTDGKITATVFVAKPGTEMPYLM